MEKIDKTKLLKNCTTETTDGVKINTKSKHVYQTINSSPEYRRKPASEIVSGGRQRAKTIILARYNMLECGANFKGTIPEICRHCNVIDDEMHRLNVCTVWNQNNNGVICNFENVFSTDGLILDDLLNQVETLWECKYANGKMKRS